MRRQMTQRARPEGIMISSKVCLKATGRLGRETSHENEFACQKRTLDHRSPVSHVIISLMAKRLRYRYILTSPNAEPSPAIFTRKRPRLDDHVIGSGSFTWAFASFPMGPTGATVICRYVCVNNNRWGNAAPPLSLGL